MIDVDIINIAIFLGVLLVSASLHEMMHAYVALRLGDDLAHSHGRISLNPFVHIDPFLTLALPAILILLGQPPILAAKPVPINTSRISGGDMGLAVVGVSGPLTNLALAFLSGLIYNITQPVGVFEDIVVMFILVNVGLFVFNMLPLPPLDGSRLLYAFAPESIQRVMRTIESFGILGLVIILMVAFPFIAPLLQNANEFIINLVT